MLATLTPCWQNWRNAGKNKAINIKDYPFAAHGGISLCRQRWPIVCIKLPFDDPKNHDIVHWQIYDKLKHLTVRLSDNNELQWGHRLLGLASEQIRTFWEFLARSEIRQNHEKCTNCFGRLRWFFGRLPGVLGTPRGVLRSPKPIFWNSIISTSLSGLNSPVVSWKRISFSSCKALRHIWNTSCVFPVALWPEILAVSYTHLTLPTNREV